MLDFFFRKFHNTARHGLKMIDYRQVMNDYDNLCDECLLYLKYRLSGGDFPEDTEQKLCEYIARLRDLADQIRS